MREIKKKEDFRRKLDKYLSEDEEIRNLFVEHIDFSSGVDGGAFLEISNFVIQDVILDGIQFFGIDFKNCTFRNVGFKNVTFHACSLENCSFSSCNFNDVGFFETELITTSFHTCTGVYMKFGDVKIDDVYFNNCAELLELYFGGCSIEKLKFYTSFLSHCRFEPFISESDNKNFDFISCEISSCFFMNMDLKNSEFNDCIFRQSTYSNCEFIQNSFVGINKAENREYCSIDFNTIRSSEDLSPQLLEQMFGIDSIGLKGYISDLTNEIVYQSVFISYSFKDRVFANSLNEKLRSRGVFTFLFERDAPGGKRLKSIMSQGIEKHDRLLFIASENSIKSEACQFELTEGRRKQERLWETIYFPIHVDDYLFKIKEDLIPKNYREEYWENIQELKEVNSMDFINFYPKITSELDFEKMVDKLIEGLRK